MADRHCASGLVPEVLKALLPGDRGRQPVSATICRMSARESLGPCRRPSARARPPRDVPRPLRRIRWSSPSPTRRDWPGPDVVDPARLGPDRPGRSGPGDVADVDEVAAGVEVADGQADRVGARLGQQRGEPAEGLRGGRPGPIGLKTRATTTSSGGRAASPAAVASHLLRP